MEKITEKGRRGIRWGLMGNLEGLEYADDTCLLSQNFENMKSTLNGIYEEAMKAELFNNCD